MVCLGTGKPGSAPPRVGPQGQARRHFDHWVSADPTGVPANLQVNSRPQTILKLPIAWITAPATDSSLEAIKYKSTKYRWGLDRRKLRKTSSGNEVTLSISCMLIRTEAAKAM